MNKKNKQEKTKHIRSSKRILQQARRALVLLGVIIVGLIASIWASGTWAPKLALDLEGGTQIVLEAQLPQGQGSPSGDQMSQAVSIIRQRIDSSGVSEAEVTTQGGKNIVVSVPGEVDAQTRNRVESSSRLEFRPVLRSMPASQISNAPGQFNVSTDGNNRDLSHLVSPTPTPTPRSPQALPSASATSTPKPPAITPVNPSDPAQITPDIMQRFFSLNCFDPAARITGVPDQTKPLVTCDAFGISKYILGPVEITGDRITNASSGTGRNVHGAATGQWTVTLEFDAEGTRKFRDVTTRLYGIAAQAGITPGGRNSAAIHGQGHGIHGNNTQDAVDRSRFAVTVDNYVITAPTANAVISDGRAEITGGFTEQSARALANQLKFGALPFSFKTQSTQTLSATLGSSSLVAGLIAAIIGLLLVLFYMFFQYRLLGIVSAVSLLFLILLTYFAVTLLSSQEGYRLSLAGIAGLIIAIGVTADSFIVYFERIKDELRDGKTLVAAVEHGWRRALRTIIASNFVSFIVAAVLFVIAVGNVRGFAITLGITTIVNIVVALLFTHSVLRFLARTAFFASGHPYSGLHACLTAMPADLLRARQQIVLDRKAS